jgi:hypothetical protein
MDDVRRYGNSGEEDRPSLRNKEVIEEATL